MPRRPMKPCIYPGCGKLVKSNERYCNEHKRETNKRYNEKRDSTIQSIYNSARWKKVRNIVMKKYGGLCQECLKSNKIVKADVVDHIVEIRDGGCEFCEDNLIPLCQACHNKKTARVKKEREGRV